VRKRDDLPSFAPSFGNCGADSPVASAPMCNPGLGWEDRVKDLISRMSVDEKISWLANSSPEVPSAGLPNYEWWSEALHGVANSPGVHWGGDFPYATCFPEPIGLAASFDRRLVRAVGNVISTEARAMNNAGQAGISFFTPNINLFRDPRWGRGQETPGEDPFLAGEYVRELIAGLQDGDDPRYLKIIADCKHFAAYDLEGVGNVTRFNFDAKVSDQDMVESFLPSFEACVRDAQVASVMCSYNSVNGVPSCANEYLLQTILRDQWNMKGFVVSDCDAVENIFSTHHYAASLEQAAAMALQAGTDLNCGSTMSKYIPGALQQGLVKEEQIDQALTRSIGTLFRSGFFDDPKLQPYRQLGPKDVNTPAAQQLAVRAARAGITLLKNTASPVATAMTLPYNNKVATPTLALIGPFANATATQAGNYAGVVSPLFLTPLQTLQAAGFQVRYAKGCDVSGNDTSGFDAAIEIATTSWYTLFVGGIDQSVEGESLDRTSLELPAIQLQLLQTLAEKMVGPANKPLSAAMYGGGPVDYSPLLDINALGGLLWLGYPGQGSGQALADVVSGTFSPAGRLVTTVYDAKYVDQVAMTDMSFRPSNTNPGRTYRFLPPQQAVFEFGTGMSYTNWEYDWFSQNNTAHGKGELPLQTVSIADLARTHAALGDRAAALNWRVNVTNVGIWNSDVVVLLFASPSVPDPTQPLKTLVAFDRLYDIAPWETQTLSLAVQARQLAEVDAQGRRWLRAGKKFVLGIDVPTKPVQQLLLEGVDTELL